MTGMDRSKVTPLRSMPGSRRRTTIWSLVGYAALAVLVLARDRGRTPVDSASDEGHHSETEMQGTSEPGRGRQADRPADIPLRGWGDILRRVYNNIQKDRVITIAA